MDGIPMSEFVIVVGTRRIKMRDCSSFRLYPVLRFNCIPFFLKCVSYLELLVRFERHNSSHYK